MKKLPLLLTGMLAISAASVRAQLVELNVSQGKPAFGDTAFGALPSRGNDGIDGTTDATNWTHADYPTSAVPYPGEVDVAPNPYWQVDLQGVFDLTRIEIVDRVGCCDPNRLEGSTITMFDSGGVAIGAPTVVTGTIPNSPAVDATLAFDNGGAGWTGVAAVRIDGLDTNQYFQFSEFRAFSMQPEPPGNAALGRPVTSSAPTWGGQPPANITDGDLFTQSHPLAEFDTLGFTYTVDLGMSFNLEAIVLRNRIQGNCCPERLSNYQVSVHEDNGAGAPGPAVWTAVVRGDGTNSGVGGADVLEAALDAAGTFAGQYIMVENLSNDPYNPQIAELEALTFDEIPEPPEPPKNYALNGVAGYFNMEGVAVAAWNGAPAGNAVDGLPNTFTHPLDMVSANYYLEIDMGEDVQVGTVAVTGRAGCCPERLEGARLDLLDAAFNVVSSTTMDGQIIARTEFDYSALPPTARYVRIHNIGGANYGPQLAEVEVFASEVAGPPLQITSFSVDPATGMTTLVWNSVPGATYGTFASSSLSEGEWEELNDNVESQGAETSTTFTDAFGAGMETRLYRVMRNPPAPPN